MNQLTRMIALGGALLLSVPGQALAAKIVVDPGHGGKDPGAHGVNGLNEKDVNLDVAARLKDELVRRGYEVVMTRTDDTYVSLSDRVDFTNRQGADLFVSMHANWYKNPETKGTMVLYYDDSAPQDSYPASDEMKALTPQSQSLAQHVLDSLVGAVGTANLGLTKSAVYVVRMGTIPSILVETAFLSNADDLKLLGDNGVRQQMAVAIERGIEGYMPPSAQAAGGAAGTGASGTAAKGFVDLSGHWARDAVLRLKDRGIVEGVGTSYEPDRPMTRAEFVTMLDRAFRLSDGCAPAAVSGGAGGATGSGTVAGAGGVSGATGTVAGAVYGTLPAGGAAPGCAPAPAAGAGFSDAAPSHWAYAALQKAVRSGLLQGYPDGTLRPDSPLKRAEAAALLKRFGSAAASALPAPVTAAAAAPFADVTGAYWAAADIAALSSAGVVDGAKAGFFQPERSMTRAEMAAMLDRYLALQK